MQGKWAISADRQPIAIICSRKIILEPIPVSVRVVVPIDVPDPLQVASALRPHQVNNMPIRCDKERRAGAVPVPFPVPGKPLAVRLQTPIDQDRTPEITRVSPPISQIRVETAGANIRQAISLFGVLLV